MRLPRLVIGAASSGAGKTSLTLGLLGALRARGLDVRPFKVGPDYIDSGLHARVTGRPSRNLDPALMGRRASLASLARNGAGGEVAVIEGVMGYYDGLPASSADLAALVRAPAVLAIDASGAAESCAATALGFLRFRRRSGIGAFILNRVAGASHYRMAAEAVTRRTGLPVLGYLASDPALSLPERHLGLAGDAARFDEVAAGLAKAVAATIDLDGLLALAGTAPELADELAAPLDATSGPRAGRPLIAVARDEAFSFYYEDNLDTLKALGAELAFWSPLRDPGPPAGSSALYLGGGYPELHAAALAANAPARAAVKAAALAGMPLYAECGGYLYLLESLSSMDGIDYPGCGLFPGRARMGARLAALGYRDCRTLAPGLAGPAGTRLSGHVFHYAFVAGGSTPVDAGQDCATVTAPALSLVSRRRPDAPPALEGAGYRNAFGSFLHVHFAANPALARRLVAAARAYAREVPGS